jgi:DNA-binding beta-propeller fold protein YncE
MRRLALLLALPCLAADLATAPALPYRAVPDWLKLPNGMTLGACSGVAVDAQDHVWIFHRGRNPVIEVDRDGRFVQAWANVQVGSAHALRAAPDGTLWGVDVKQHQVVHYDRQGRVLQRLGDPQGRPGDNASRAAFNQPTAIAFGADGALFITDGYGNSRVVEFNRAGQYVRQWGSKGAGDGQFDIVHDIVVDARGLLYVADRNNQRVQIFDQRGKFLGKWTAGVGSPWGLHYARAENAFYLCDGVNNRVLKLDANGRVVGALGAPGAAPGQFQLPHYLALDSAGAIYVAEVRNQRVQKFVK